MKVTAINDTKLLCVRDCKRNENTQRCVYMCPKVVRFNSAIIPFRQYTRTIKRALSPRPKCIFIVHVPRDVWSGHSKCDSFSVNE